MAKVNLFAGATIGRLQITLPDSDFVISSKIVGAMVREVNKKLGSAGMKRDVLKGVQRALRKALRNQPEYVEMSSQDGILRAELGVVDSQEAMEKIIAYWTKGIEVTMSPAKKIGNGVGGTILIVNGVPGDYGELLGKSFASYLTNRGRRIPWLDWLLTKGDQELIEGYWTGYGETSRTGTNTVMVKTKGAAWGVPMEYSGIPDDNYATRAIAEAKKDIEKAIAHEVQRRLPSL